MQFITNKLLDAVAKKSDVKPQKGGVEIKGRVEAKGPDTKRQKQSERKIRIIAFSSAQVLPGVLVKYKFCFRRYKAELKILHLSHTHRRCCLSEKPTLSTKSSTFLC